MKRHDGSEDFYVNRLWNDYKIGFGDLNGEFWLLVCTANQDSDKH